jgi:hypothetical protein
MKGLHQVITLPDFYRRVSDLQSLFPHHVLDATPLASSDIGRLVQALYR